MARLMDLMISFQRLSPGRIAVNIGVIAIVTAQLLYVCLSFVYDIDYFVFLSSFTYLFFLGTGAMFVTYHSIKHTRNKILGLVHPACLYSWLFFIFFGIGSMPGLIGIKERYIMEATYYGYFVAGILSILTLFALGCGVICFNSMSKRLKYQPIHETVLKFFSAKYLILTLLYLVFWYLRLDLIFKGGLIRYGWAPMKALLGTATGIDIFVKGLSVFVLPIIFMFVLIYPKKKIYAILVCLEVLYLLMLNSRSSLIFALISCIVLYCIIRQKIPWKLLCGGVFLSAILFLVLIEARNTGKLTSLMSSNVFDYLLRNFLDAFGSIFSFEELRSSFHSLIVNMYFRLDMLQPLAAMIDHGTLGDKGFVYGESFVFYTVTMIPKVLYPGPKPILQSGEDLAISHFDLPRFDIAFPITYEFYLNFGMVGSIIGILLLGMFLSWIYSLFVLRPSKYQLWYAALYAGILISILKIERGFKLIFDLRILVILLLCGWILQLKNRPNPNHKS